MRINYWRLQAGGMVGQETADQKLAEGLAFIERLKSEGETVMSVETLSDRLKIVLADPQDLVETTPEVIPVETVEQVVEIPAETPIEIPVEQTIETPIEPIITE